MHNSNDQPEEIRKKCLVCGQVLALQQDIEHCPRDGSLLIPDLDCQSFDLLYFKQALRKMRITG
jgi:hypothetical protein